MMQRIGARYRETVVVGKHQRLGYQKYPISTPLAGSNPAIMFWASQEYHNDASGYVWARWKLPWLAQT